MVVHLSFNRWAEPTKVLDTDQLARATVHRWVKDTEGNGSAESLVHAFESVLNDVLKQLCDA